jgi:hypothetical protein
MSNRKKPSWKAKVKSPLKKELPQVKMSFQVKAGSDSVWSQHLSTNDMDYKPDFEEEASDFQYMLEVVNAAFEKAGFDFKSIRISAVKYLVPPTPKGELEL